MAFRFKAFGLHLMASLVILTVLLGSLYFGWYRWPGWYLADVSHVILVMVGVDVVAGPLLTAIVANAKKPRSELARDISMIAVVQLCALVYGSVSLWNGRPLYYAFSENVLQLVQAYDIDAGERDLARIRKVELRPHWYSLPRWIWAPLPQDPQEHDKIMAAAVAGGDDVISMPRYYKAWDAGLPLLRTQLKKVADIGYFSGQDKKLLAEQMRVAGYSATQANAIALTGRGKPLLAVFDPATITLRALFRVK